MVVVAIYVRLSPEAAPAVPRSAWREKLSSLQEIWPTALVFVLVVGGIYLGWFSPTEGAAIGAAAVGVLAVTVGGMRWRGLRECLVGTAETTALIFLILMGAEIFNAFLALTQMPQELGQVVLGLDAPPLLVIAAMLLIYILLGCVMELCPALECPRGSAVVKRDGQCCATCSEPEQMKGAKCEDCGDISEEELQLARDRRLALPSNSAPEYVLVKDDNSDFREPEGTLVGQTEEEEGDAQADDAAAAEKLSTAVVVVMFAYSSTVLVVLLVLIFMVAVLTALVMKLRKRVLTSQKILPV